MFNFQHFLQCHSFVFETRIEILKFEMKLQGHGSLTAIVMSRG